MGQCEDDIKIPFPVVHSILIRREKPKNQVKLKVENPRKTIKNGCQMINMDINFVISATSDKKRHWPCQALGLVRSRGEMSSGTSGWRAECHAAP